MTFNKQHRNSASILILAITFVMQLYVPGAALCLEEDGDASIEDYSSGFCADSFADSNASAAPMNVEKSPGDHCSDCFDIPLAERITKKEADSGCGTDMAARMQIFSAYVSPVSLCETTTYKRPFTDGRLNKSTLSGIMKTVILIC
jgi:hypothetical protein